MISCGDVEEFYMDSLINPSGTVHIRDCDPESPSYGDRLSSVHYR